ncbi:MAG: hypothetical protein PHU79_05280 [Oscillospiraceae bacterium]|nr:hypothetical protein [Oscillospiraceae bacterium]
MEGENVKAALPQEKAAAPNKMLEYLGMWLLGGGCYCLLEAAWRGWTHWTMFLAGGTLFLLIGLEHGPKDRERSLAGRGMLAGLTITAGEFLTGCVVNLWLHMGVWDYSAQPYNLLGQVSLLASLGWCAVGLLAVLFYDMLVWRLFGEERPHYKFFR